MHFTNSNATTPRSRVRTPIHELALVAIIEDDGKPATDESFSRCGWFDSSLDLAAGLLVTEFVDDLPAGLPFEVQ